MIANETGLSKGIRISQIVLGAVAIILSLAILVDPGLGIATLIFLLSVTLLFVGIERVAVGVFPNLTKSSRIGNIVLGVLAIGLGIAVIAFPLLATIFLVSLLAVGLLFVGVARIIHGIVDKKISRWSRIFLIGVGILSLAVSFIVFASPILGVILLTLILAINLLIIGIESIAHGISSRTYIATSAPSSSSADYGK